MFSDDPENVWVDTAGRLHLRITHRDGGWQCAEVYSDLHLGHGVYRFDLDTAPAALDPNVVLGCFSYSDNYDADHDEIDVEFARWGVSSNDNTQFVVQPYNLPGHIERFDVAPSGGLSTHQFVWTANEVGFESREGRMNTPGALFHAWAFDRPDIPVPDVERMRFNLWLFQGAPPSDGLESEVVIASFAYGSNVGIGQPGAAVTGTRLLAPAPNPIRGSLDYGFVLPRATRVRVTLVDLMGRAVRVLVDEALPAGTHRRQTRMTPVEEPPPGVYALVLATREGRWSRRVTLLR